MSKKTCNVCTHHCNLDDNQIGLCHARSNIKGEITTINYGFLTSIALDPIEKKPLRKFYPGSKILSIGSFGCNLSCSFCQNHEISMCSMKEAKTRYVKPEDLISEALDLKHEGNIGIAYTYNEPLVGFEYVRDCAILARQNDLKNVVVTNGCFCEGTINELLPFIDAFNIDLKGFTEEFYRKIGGDLETVKNFIKLAAKSSHVEITTLIIPDENDSEEEIRNISKFIASINPDIPLHLSRFFPSYKMSDKDATKISKIYSLTEIARESLYCVYSGNC